MCCSRPRQPARRRCRGRRRQNTDGSALTNLAGYRIYYGTNANSLTQTVNIGTVGVTTHMVNSLSAGTWYFAIRSYNASGVESDLSNVASKTIT
jgi:hypothetical protein